MGLLDGRECCLYRQVLDEPDMVCQTMIDRKLEPLVKRQMIKYLGELEDDDLVMFVLEHLKDHKTPQKLIEGLEPVRGIRISFLHTQFIYPCRFWRRKPSSLLSACGDKSFSRVWHMERAYTPND